MTRAEQIIETMLPNESFDNENKKVLSIVQALEFGEKIAWEAWKEQNRLWAALYNIDPEMMLFEMEFKNWYREEIQEK